MFEDEINIDDILESPQTTKTLSKRLSSSFDFENSNKRLKTDNDGCASSSTAKPKVFRFKKKETIRNEVDETESNENNNLSRSIFEITERNRTIKVIRNENELQSTEKHSHGSSTDISKSRDQYVRKCSESRISSDKNITKRRFPGPAGLLPERNLSSSAIEHITESSNVETKDMDEICSQSSFITFNEEPWEKMMADFKTGVVCLPEKYDVQWIRSRTRLKKLINQKAPFLAAFVDGIKSHTIQNPIVNLVLKDKTGTIQGTILHTLYEEHAGSLTVGSVVVLKDIGVLNTEPNEEPYLTITRNNLLSIYTKRRTNDGSSQTENDVSKTILQDICADQILARINETKRVFKINNQEKQRIQIIPSSNKDIRGPINLSNTFRKVIHNVKSGSDSNLPNLNVLRLKSTQNLSKEVSNIAGCSKNDDQINDLMNFFKTDEGIVELFDEEPNFCSTQKENVNKSMETKTETCDREKSQIFEDLFDGVDASALFDEF